jgi:metal-responsive CopG/Arc/MetJ family transcriptional regulator
MAKVMISIPDDLLRRLDEQAKRRRTTRSGLLRQFAERELALDAESRREEILAILERAQNHGGDVARLVREDRESH